MNVILVTGGSAGLGHAMVKVGLKREYNVTFFSRHSGPESKAEHRELDLSEPSKVSGVFESMLNQLSFEKIESVTLINNAGRLSPIGPIDRISSDLIETGMSINLTAPVILTSCFIKATQVFKGRKVVVNISSGAAVKAYSGWSLYCTAKAGLEHFTRCVALEQTQVEFPTTLVNVNPGVMDTSMQSLIRNTHPDSFPSHGRFVKMHEEKQLVDPLVVAELIYQGIFSDRLESGETYKVEEFAKFGDNMMD